MAEEPKKEQAQFNDMNLQIQRLHNLWTDINHLRQLADLEGIQRKLTTAQQELNPDARKLDKDIDTDFVKQLEDVNKKINDIPFATLKLAKNPKLNISDKDEIKNLSRNMLYPLLLEKEDIIREVQQVAGKGTKYTGSNEDDLD